ncbi:hypothetical protein ACL02O_19635, partial [Micromonospora sp. MS34]|uniref:hypothetical protein n=1 Tax=Micromonospora sp. MS34 TaxID=3385971 RepID=UPI0039A0C0E7
MAVERPATTLVPAGFRAAVIRLWVPVEVLVLASTALTASAALLPALRALVEEVPVAFFAGAFFAAALRAPPLGRAPAAFAAVVLLAAVVFFTAAVVFFAGAFFAA